MLDPFELQNMRFRWRKWGIFDCNWKVALEAFNETYHVPDTHPEFNKFGEFRGWARAHGKHSNIGYDAPEDGRRKPAGKLRLGTGDRAPHHRRDADLHLGEGQHQHHADAGRCRAAL